MKFIDEKIEKYAYDHTQSEGDFLLRVQKETHASLECPQMLTGRIEGRLLKLLAQLVGAKRILEIGTFSGYSSLSMAEALPDDGELITCENDPPAIEFALRSFAQNPHGKKITLREGPALETIKTLAGFFDLSFIDADKLNYLNYFEAILPLTRAGGLIVVDNVLWSGRVLNPVDDYDKAICHFNETVIRDARVEQIMLPIRDGIYCIRKK